MSTVEYSTEIDAPPELVWDVTSDPRNLAFWDARIRRVHAPEGGLEAGVRFDAEVGYRGIRTVISCEVMEWEPPELLPIMPPKVARFSTQAALKASTWSGFTA